MKKQLFKFIFTSSIVLLTVTSCQEKVKSEISVKNDTLVTKVLNIDDKKDLEKNGFYAEEFFIIANKSYLRTSPDKNSNNIIDTLQFGSIVRMRCKLSLASRIYKRSYRSLLLLRSHLVPGVLFDRCRKLI